MTLAICFGWLHILPFGIECIECATANLRIVITNSPLHFRHLSRFASAQQEGPSSDDGKSLPPPEPFRRANNSPEAKAWVTERGEDGGVIPIGQNGHPSAGSVDELPFLLANFTALHRNGQLEEAAEMLQRAFEIMGSSQDRVPIGRDNFDHAVPETGVEEDVEVSAPAITMSGVMNDLGCTFQQVGKLSTN